MLTIESPGAAEQALRSSRQIMIERVQLAISLMDGARSILRRIQQSGLGSRNDQQVQDALDGADDAADAVLATAKILVEAKVVTRDQIEGVEQRVAIVTKRIGGFRQNVRDGFAKRDVSIFNDTIFGIVSAMQVILDCQAIASELRNVWELLGPTAAAAPTKQIPSTVLTAEPVMAPVPPAPEKKASVWPWVAAGAAALFVIPTLGGLGEFVKFVGPTAGFSLGMALLNPKKREPEARDARVLRLLRLRQRVRALR